MLCAVLLSENAEKLMTTKDNKKLGTVSFFKSGSMYKIEFSILQLHTYLC